MRKQIVAGNWKMNTTLPEGLALAKGIDEALRGKTVHCDVILGTPFTHLASVAAAIDTTRIGVAAENCADKEKGAFTGEVSAAMIASTGARYVIIGHSERRAYYHETPEILKEKVRLALAHGLTPIFCVGEVLAEREAGKHFDVPLRSYGRRLRSPHPRLRARLGHRHRKDSYRGSGTGDPRTHPPDHRRQVWRHGGRRHLHPLRRQLQRW